MIGKRSIYLLYWNQEIAPPGVGTIADQRGARKRAGWPHQVAPFGTSGTDRLPGISRCKDYTHGLSLRLCITIPGPITRATRSRAGVDVHLPYSIRQVFLVIDQDGGGCVEHPGSARPAMPVLLPPIARRNSMTHLDQLCTDVPFTLPTALPLLRARVTLRILDDTTLPPWKGALLRGGFGYAFQRATCPQRCWGHADACSIGTLCPYRRVFETPHPPDIGHLHDLKDVPRPFVIEPPGDQQRQYAAGSTLEFGLVLIGRGIDYLPYFLFAFEQLGRMGLGRQHAQARLERVEALHPWQPTGRVIYQDGRVQGEPGATTADWLPVYRAATIAERAAALPADLRLELPTPLRVKARGAFIETIDPPALVQALCWRLNALATFHGDGPWPVDYRPLVAQAQAITVEQAQVRWVDWERTSTRGDQRQKMKLGGIVGSARLRAVPPDVRTLLLAGSLVHVGKACVFGHGALGVRG